MRERRAAYAKAATREKLVPDDSETPEEQNDAITAARDAMIDRQRNLWRDAKRLPASRTRIEDARAKRAASRSGKPGPFPFQGANMETFEAGGRSNIEQSAYEPRSRRR